MIRENLARGVCVTSTDDVTTVTGRAPYRGPDRRGVARFVVPARTPTAILLVLALAWIAGASRIQVRTNPRTIVEIGAIAATLALLGGIACLLRWRLDGIAADGGADGGSS